MRLIFTERVKRWGNLLAWVVVPAFANLAAGNEVVIALKPDKNPEAMMRERESLAAYAERALGRKTRVIIPLSSAVILEGLANGSIDLAYLSAADMLLARERGVAEVLVAGEIGGRTWYSSIWVSLSGAPWQSVEELRGRRVAFASRTSTSGFVVPYWDLVKKGVLQAGDMPEAFFGAGNVRFGAGYVSAVEMVLAGEADAAAVSDYVLGGPHHLTAEQKARLRRVAEQGPVPTHVLAVRRTLEFPLREALRSMLLEMNTAAPALRDQVFTSRLVEVDEDAHLAPIAAAMQAVRQIR